MFTYNLFPKLLNKVAQEIMSDSDKLIKVIIHYQQALEHYAKKKNDAKMLHCIFKLSHMPITRKHLEETGVGRTVNSLRRLDEVGDAARGLVAKWKDMVSKQEEQEEEEEGEEEVLNIKSDTSKDSIKKSGQREKTDDNRSNSSHRHSDKNSDKGEKFSNHKKEKHKDGSHSSRGSHVSTSQKDQKERHSRERRRSYERHSDEDNHERSQSYNQKELNRARSFSNISDSERSTSNESLSEAMTSDSGHESDTNGNLKSRNSKGNKVDSKRHSESHSKDKRMSSNSSDRKSHKSANQSNSKERTYSKPKEHSRDKSREKKKKEDDKHRDLKKDSAKRMREHSDSSDSEQMHKKHHSSENSKHKSYEDNSTDSDSSQEALAKEISDDDIRSSSQKRDVHKKDIGRKEKERKESHRSSSHHNSSKSENKKSSEKSKDSNKKEKSSKESTKNDKKSDRKSESKTKNKPINEEIIKTENGICSSFGASFADALGMLEPTTSKGIAKKSKPYTVTSTPEKLKPEKSPEKRQSSKSDIALPSLPSKLEPIDIDISSLLPTITPNYRPLGNVMENIHNSRSKILNDDEALCMVMSSKNQRTKVYSGNKIMWNTVPTLFELCTRILQDNIDALEYTGGVPYCILKPVLDKATPDQLFVMEHHNPYLMEDTDELWQLHCQREFRNKQREEMETWREMYMRCLDEREAKLKTLKANIKQSQEKSTPVRKTQLAYIDSIVKPPRNVLKKQMKSGTEKRPAITPASRLTALATSGAAGQIVVPNPGSRASSSGGSSSAHMKPKKAPLMQKTLQFLKGGRFRR